MGSAGGEVVLGQADRMPAGSEGTSALGSLGGHGLDETPMGTGQSFRHSMGRGHRAIVS